MSTAKKVKIGSNRKFKAVSLPSLEGSEVLVYENLLVSEQRAMQEKYPDPSALNNKQSTEMSLYMLTLAIREWNLEKEDGTGSLPVTIESFDKLTLPDILKMLEVCTGQKLLDEQNRPLSATNPALGKKVTAA